MNKKKLKKVVLKEKAKVSIASPNGDKLKPHTIHIEKIFKSSKEGVMIVYRTWSKKRQRWKFYVESFDTLYLWNDHIFNLKLYEKNKNKNKNKKGIKKPLSQRVGKTEASLD